MTNQDSRLQRLAIVGMVQSVTDQKYLTDMSKCANWHDLARLFERYARDNLHIEDIAGAYKIQLTITKG